MVLQTEIYTHDFRRIYDRFCDAIGDSHWKKRAALIHSEILGHKHLKDYLLEENAITFALDRCADLIAKYKGFPQPTLDQPAVYQAISFAAQVLSVLDACEPKKREPLVKRVRGSFKNPDDMRAIRTELTAATHFTRRGYGITWPEMEGTGRFDVLVSNIGNEGLEVECKSISNDKGRKIHRRDAIDFHHLLQRELTPAIRNLSTGLAVVLTVPERLPTTPNNRKALAREVVTHVIRNSPDDLTDGSTIRIEQFDPSVLGGIEIMERNGPPRATMERLTRTNNREMMVIHNHAGGAVIFATQSTQDDSFIDYVYDTLSDAAEHQLTKSRPGLLLAAFEGVSPEMLIDVAAQDATPTSPATAIRLAADAFIKSEDRGHVVGLSYLSRGSLMPQAGGNVDSGGTSYYFKNSASPFWHEEFDRIFSSV